MTQQPVGHFRARHLLFPPNTYAGECEGICRRATDQELVSTAYVDFVGGNGMVFPTREVLYRYTLVVAERDELRRNAVELQDVLLWALRQNYHLDHMNSAIHCADVRYSPITFRLAEALAEYLGEAESTENLPIEVSHVIQHVGAYEEDPGR